MKTKYLALAGAIFLVGLDLLFFILDWAPSGIKLAVPLSGRKFPGHFVAEGHAWHENAKSKHTVTVVARKIAPKTTGSNTEKTVTKEAPRDAVRDKGKILYLLNSFHALFDLEGDGEWRVTAILKDESGKEVIRKSHDITIQRGIPNREFRTFSEEHLIPALMVLLACIAVGVYFRKEPSSKARAITEATIVLILFTNETIYHIYWYVTDGWVPSSGLLIQMCGLSILMLITVFYVESPRVKNLMYDLIFFWGLGGALQAILAPDIGARGFPDFKYFSFFISHGFIMIGASYIVAAHRYRPTLKALLKVAIITNLLVIVSYGFNILLEKVPPFERGNYFITGYPPPTGSIVDLFARTFGPSPRYLIGLEIMGLAVFLLLWAPFGIRNVRNSRRGISGKT